MADKRPQIQASGMEADTWYAASSYDAAEAAAAAAASGNAAGDGKSDGRDNGTSKGLPFSRDVTGWPPHGMIPVTTVYYDLTTDGPSFWKDSSAAGSGEEPAGDGEGGEGTSEEAAAGASGQQAEVSGWHTNVSGCQLPGHGVSTNAVKTGYGHSGTLKARISSGNAIKAAVSGANKYDSLSGSTSSGLSGMLDTSKYKADGVSIGLESRVFSLLGFKDADTSSVPYKGEDGKLSWAVSLDDVPWLGTYLTGMEARLQTQIVSGDSEAALARLDELVSSLYSPLTERVESIEAEISGLAGSEAFTELAGRVEALENRPDDSPAIQSLQQAVNDISSSLAGKAGIDELDELLQGKADAESTAQSISDLAERLDALSSGPGSAFEVLSATVALHTDQIQALNTIMSMGGSTAVQQLTSRVGLLEEASSQLGGRIESVDADVNRLEDQFSALSGSVGSVLESVNAVNAEAREAKEEARALIAAASQGTEAYELARFAAERLFNVAVSSEYAKFGDLPAVDPADPADVAEAAGTVYTLEDGSAYIYDAELHEYVPFEPEGDTLVFACGDASTGD